MNVLKRAARKISLLVDLPADERSLTLEAFFWLALARVWLLIAPFNKIAAKLGEARQPGAASSDLPAVTPEQEAMAYKIAWAIHRASKNVKFRAVCIQQAIAAKLMLRRRGIACVMHFGVAKGNFVDERMRAHAWLNVQDVKVTGYPISVGLQEIACFV